MNRTKSCVLILLIFVVVGGIVMYFWLKKDPHFSKAAVAADSKKCSEIGRDILQQGGSAVDGAIAALLCTSVINSQSMGIGGGAVFTVMDSSGEVKIINCRETAPSNMKPDLLDSCPRPTESVAGSRWIGVPGELRGYEKAHKLYGKLPWADLFKPTIKLAREGIKIPPVQGSYIPDILDSKEARPLRDLFSDKNGNLLQTGDVVKFEKLADTLETIANNGADSFYTGKIAEDLISDVQQAGGTLTLQDLANYNATVTDAWAVPFGEYKMYIPPPPAGGVLLGLILNILKGLTIKSEPQSVEEQANFFHHYVEAFKIANEELNKIRDPSVEPDNMAKELITENYAANKRSFIHETHNRQHSNITSYPDSLGTSHVSVLAEDGSVVSVTSSINYMFGSQIYSSRTGIILNNQLTDFCERVKKINPGERPPSFKAPSVLKSESKVLVIGSAGGRFITTGMASALINRLWFGKSLKEAIATPVVFVNPKDEVMFEPNFNKNVIQALKSRGHKAEKFYNVVNAVEKDGGRIYAESDARKQGEAAGY